MLFVVVGLSQAQVIVKKSFQEIHERYKLMLERM